MKLQRVLMFVLVCGLAGMLACNKDDNNEQKQKDPESNTTQDHSTMSNEFDFIYDQMEEATTDNSDSLGRTSGITTSSCATATLKGAPTGDSIIIDFNDGTCENSDGKYREGTIRIHATGKYRDSGTVITTVLDGYHVSDSAIDNNNHGKHLTGAKVVENLGNNEYSVTVSADTDGNGMAELTFTDGTSIKWESQRTRSWVQGSGTPLNFSDDVYEITGSASGVSRNDRNFTADITSPLVVKIECWQSPYWVFHPVEGVLEVKPQDLATRKIDYGNGNCDRKATLTVNDFSITIFLR